MRTRRHLAAIVATVAFTVLPLITNPLAADEVRPQDLPGTLAVFDEPDSSTRLVLFDSTSGEPADVTRSGVVDAARVQGLTVVWIPFKYAQFKRDFANAVRESATLSGVQIEEVTLQFSDAKNVSVLLDLSLPGSAYEALVVGAANQLLKELSPGSEIQFGAKPGRVTLKAPDQERCVNAINEDLARPEVRLAGCRITKISFDTNEDSRSTLIEGTIAFMFQEDAVIAAAKETLSRLGYEDWLEVRPVDTSGSQEFEVRPPAMNLFVTQLRQALRDDDSTALMVILCDATLEPSEIDPEKLVVNLDGHISRKETEGVVVDVANHVAAAFFGPYRANVEAEQEFNVIPGNLLLKPTSRSASHQYQRLAHSYIQQCRLPEAVNAFELAAFEDRQAMKTMYWLAVAYLKIGDEDSARMTLRRTVRRNARLMEDARLGRNNDYVDLMRALESVQGSLRQRLHDLEGEVYADYCTRNRHRT